MRKRKIKKVGQKIFTSLGNWNFKKISSKFDIHAKKSIPLYLEGHKIITDLSTFFLNDNSLCYDLGSSTGVLLNKIYKKNQMKKNLSLIGIDIESDMIKHAKRRFSKKIKFQHKNIVNLKLKKADLIICYYTMQFIKPKFRQRIFDKIYKSLNWGGAFIFFEKVRAPDARFQDLSVQIYNNFKIDQNFSAQEIIQKSLSLQGILEPYSTNENFRMLKRAKFKDYMSIMKYICFEGFLAIK
tara:strand:- start:625 stop:1344 length:720 start_codon:yes stop_codon:yes gene_type:complete